MALATVKHVPLGTTKLRKNARARRTLCIEAKFKFSPTGNGSWKHIVRLRKIDCTLAFMNTFLFFTYVRRGSKFPNRVRGGNALDKAMDGMPITRLWRLQNAGEFEIASQDGTEVTVGRKGDSASVVLEVPTVSAVHASFDVSGGGLYVKDLQSSNGTWVDGEMLQAGERRKVELGSELILGDQFLARFLVAHEDDASEVQTESQ